MNRYGKEIDMRNINRNLCGLKNMINNCKQSSVKNLKKDHPNLREKCSVCGNDEYKKFVNVYGYDYCECIKCNSIFMINLPNIPDLYKEDPNTPIEHYINEELFNKRVSMIAKPKVEYILDSVNNCSNDNIWIDIGCGTGEILSVVSKNGWNTIGIEADKRECKFAKDKGITVINKFFDSDNEDEEIIKALNKAKIISFFNVLEHIEEPYKYINYIYKYIKEDSFIVFEVPRYPSLASFANLTSPGNVYRHIVPPQHLQIFTEVGLDFLLKDKFKIISKWGFGQGFCDIITNSMLNAKIEDNKLYNEMIDISNKVQKVIDENGFSDTMIFIAKKV